MPREADLTVEQFVAKTTRDLTDMRGQSHLCLGWAGRDLTYEEIVRLDHSRWYDPEAVKKLLAGLNDRELVLALNFMLSPRLTEADYLGRVDPTDDLLKLGRHESPAVRRAFAVLMEANRFWPSTIYQLEPLLTFDDEFVVLAVLGEFNESGVRPQNENVLKSLAESDDEIIQAVARRLMHLPRVEHSKEQRANTK
jgi:hypothetical protein